MAKLSDAKCPEKDCNRGPADNHHVTSSGRRVHLSRDVHAVVSQWTTNDAEDRKNECPECQSRELTWSVKTITSVDGPADGLLRKHDVRVILVLGCDSCSETVRIMDADGESGIAFLNR